MRYDLAAGALSGLGIGVATGLIAFDSLWSGLGIGVFLGAGVLGVLAGFDQEG